MSKVNLDPIVSIQNVQKINDNFQKIVDELDNNTFSRNPVSSPNFLEVDLDMNGNRILNVPAPVSDTDLVRKMDVEALASPDLSLKQDKLVSGVNIKTINGETLLGSGDIEIVGGGGSSDHSLLTNRNIANQHTIAAITGLQSTLDGKAATAHTHIIGDVTGLQVALDTKAAVVHTHVIGDVTGLQFALDSKAAVSHTHAIADVTNLQTTLDGKAATSHTHTIANVTGLQTALDSKQATLVSSTNIKTINGASILGSGDLIVTGSGGEINTASNLGAGTGIYATKVASDLQFKSLVAGTNVTLSNDANTITINASGGGGSTDHSTLTNRNIADQHPISAITGLQTVLDAKAPTDVATTSVNGLMSAADKTKLNGIAAGATVNSSDATLLARANHTGTQAISTVTNLQTELDGKQKLITQSGTAPASPQVGDLWIQI